MVFTEKMHPIILLALFAVVIEQSLSNYHQLCASEPARTVFVNSHMPVQSHYGMMLINRLTFLSLCRTLTTEIDENKIINWSMGLVTSCKFLHAKKRKT